MERSNQRSNGTMQVLSTKKSLVVAFLCGIFVALVSIETYRRTMNWNQDSVENELNEMSMQHLRQPIVNQHLPKKGHEETVAGKSEDKHSQFIENLMIPVEKILEAQKDHAIVTTNPSVPKLFKDLLLKYAKIDETLTTSMPATSAVEKLEKEVGWDPKTSTFINPAALQSLVKQGLSASSISVADKNSFQERPLHDMVDIVVPSIRDLDFLEDWKPFIEKFHIIIIQDGDPSKLLKIPAWADYELYNRLDIDRALGDKSWIISSKDASIRNFGFLVSDKDFVYTLDDDCLPATKPGVNNAGEKVNAIVEHMTNLLTPATPHFFNTVYDPYRPGVDFVRGYPYSLRSGVPTAISHGLWMNTYDYDAPTQLLKVSERNTNYADITQTIPKGVLYPMCSMNVAFNKKLIGPAFMQGLMGEGQPWARYDDMFAGWASKVVADHLDIGVKSGAPYIHHNKASNPFTNLKKEYMGLFWQDEIIQFMSHVKLSETSNTAAKAYIELAEKIESGLGHLNAYFPRLAKAMKLWIEVWEARFGGNHGEYDCYDPAQYKVNAVEISCLPSILPLASRSSMAPRNPDETCAVFTIAHNEGTLLPIWLRYYIKAVGAEHLWVLDHNSNDGSTEADKIPSGVHVRKLYGEAAWMPHYFLNRQVELHQQRLFRAGYKCVLFTEIDEIVVPDPAVYPGGLREYFKTYLNPESEIGKKPAISVYGHHIAHDSKAEAAIDLTKPILQQRKYWYQDPLFSKPLLSKVPLRYIVGHHAAQARNYGVFDGAKAEHNLVMFHLHSFDNKQCVDRERAKYDGAVSHGKKDEDKLGMNIFAHKTFEEIIVQSHVCGLTMLSNEGKQMKTPTGALVEKIPERYSVVDI